MKRKIYWLWGIVAFVIGIICMRDEKYEITIPESINYLLNYNGISNASISCLGKYSDLKLDIETTVISDEEVNDYVALYLESFSEIIPVIDRNEVQNGDVVYVSYIVFKDGEIINYIQSDNLIVGAGKYNETIEKAVVGKSVGEPFSIYISSQDDGREDIMYSITIESINYFKTYELTDEFVKQRFNIASVEEYYNYIRELLMEEKKAQAEKVAVDDLYKEIIDRCTINIDIDEVASYSQKIVEEYGQLAYLYNMSIDEYIGQVLEKDIDIFYEECYNYGEFEIKKYLVVGAIYSELGYQISDELYREMCEELECGYEEAKADEYIDALIQYKIMQQKLVDFFY